MTISPSSTWIDTIGIDPSAVVDQIVQKGVSKFDAAKLINNLVAVNLGQAPRSFVYSGSLPDATADAPTFTRTFTHQDWVDGESVVQASESADDRGFNWRFNAIAGDLDGLHADTSNVFTFLSQLRETLLTSLQDIAAELNRIDTDIATIYSRLPAQLPWRFDVADAPQFMGVRELDGSKVTMWKTLNNVMMLPAVDTVGLQDTTAQRLDTSGMVVAAVGDNAAFTTDLAGNLTASALIDKYGGTQLADGRTLGQALAVLPPDATFADMSSLSDAVNTQEQAFIRSTVGSVDAIQTVIGVTSQNQPISAIASTTLAFAVADAPAGLSTGLANAGLDTIGAVAQQTPAQIVSSLQAKGVTVTDTQALQLISRAKMVNGLHFQ